MTAEQGNIDMARFLLSHDYVDVNSVHNIFTFSLVYIISIEIFFMTFLNSFFLIKFFSCYFEYDTITLRCNERSSRCR